MLNCVDVFPKVLFSFGQVQVHTYGTFIALSAFVGFFIIRSLGQKKLSTNEIIDLIFWAMIGGVLGARIFYVLVYNFEYFRIYPKEIWAVWHGGLSIHGGLLGGALALWIFARIQKKRFLAYADLVVIALVFGLGVGRIANFINGELIGRITEFPIACDFGDGLARWPVQLIDSAKNFLIFGILAYLYSRQKVKTGVVSGLFLVLIGLLRFLTEFLREPDPQIGFIFANFSIGQFLAFLTICAGVILLLELKRKRRKTAVKKKGRAKAKVSKKKTKK